MKYLTRIAPSPTGDMHLGTARTAYFNWLAAKASGGQFILRIDDTDKARNDEVHIADIVDTMNWLGLNYDAVYMQSARFDRYRQIAIQLIKKGKAKVLDDGAVIFDTTNQLMLRDYWTDELAGDIDITDTNLEHMSNMVLIRSDESPTYNFASVVDDIDFGVNFVIRGQDHMSNTPKQVALFDSLDHPLPKFAHVGLIHYNKKKLSKRKKEVGDAPGAGNMMYYRDKGYDPDAVLNFILRLGWGPTVDDKTTKMIDRDRALELFLDGGKMRAAPSNMDLNMLEAFDRKYKAKKGIWRNKDKLVTNG